jgi:hypothetical protein
VPRTTLTLREALRDLSQGHTIKLPLRAWVSRRSL